jgi:hypothetical protein
MATIFFLPEMATTEWVRIPLSGLVLWNSFLWATCFLDVPKTYFSSIPLSLNPISNGEVVHPGKMFLDGLLPAFFHNQSGLA